MRRATTHAPPVHPVCFAPIQSDAFCKQLQPLVNKLNADLPDAKYDIKGLGLTVGHMLQFQEDALGVNVGSMRHALHAQQLRALALMEGNKQHAVAWHAVACMACYPNVGC